MRKRKVARLLDFSYLLNKLNNNYSCYICCLIVFVKMNLLFYMFLQLDIQKLHKQC